MAEGFDVEEMFVNLVVDNAINDVVSVLSSMGQRIYKRDIINCFSSVQAKKLAYSLLIVFRFYYPCSSNLNST